MAIYQLGEHAPQIHPTAFIADNAQVIGRVHMAEDSSVWFGVVVRGDTDDIRIGRGSNVQDNTVLHTDDGIELVIGEHVTIGHRWPLEQTAEAHRALEARETTGSCLLIP